MHRLPLCVPLVVLTSLVFPAAAWGEARNFKVVTDKTVDPTSLESIVRDVWTRSGAKTNDEKAIAIYEYLHNTIFHHAYSIETAPQSVGPLKAINAYGWSLCGGQHTILKALYEAAGWECRYLGWPGHTTIEVQYDGTWHYFDVFLKVYFWSKDKTHVVSQEEIANDPSIVLDAVKEGRAARQHLCCGDTEADVIEGCKARNVIGNAKGWASVTWRDENYSPKLQLPAGASLRLDWKPESDGFAVKKEKLLPQHTCGTKDFRSDKVLGPILEHYGPRNWSNGQLAYAPDFSKVADLADIQLMGATAKEGKLVATAPPVAPPKRGVGRLGGAAIFRVPLPYPYVRASVAADFVDNSGRIYVSTDSGKTWEAVVAGDLSKHVKQRYNVWLRVEFAAALNQLRLDALVEHNRSALPYLVPGKNTVTVSLDDKEVPKGCVLRVSYAYQEATVPNPEKRSRFEGQDVSYGPVKTVTKEIAAVPFTFAIDVGGNTPPKMISLERTVRSR